MRGILYKVGGGTVKISDRWSFGKNEKKVERRKHVVRVRVTKW